MKMCVQGKVKASPPASAGKPDLEVSPSKHLADHFQSCLDDFPRVIWIFFLFWTARYGQGDGHLYILIKIPK